MESRRPEDGDAPRTPRIDESMIELREEHGHLLSTITPAHTATAHTPLAAPIGSIDLR